MSQRPIFVATHPRACSTAFERVFMTRRDTIQCVHEPFGDAFYYGPERLATRFQDDEKARLESGFSQSTYKTVMDRIEREASEGKRVFIKDIIHYLLPPSGKPATIAPSLDRLKRGVGTETNSHTVENGCNGHEESGRSTKQTSQKHPYPYHTESEPGNPTVMPKELLSKFHFAFLIRDPHFSVPSYYRCTIPPLDDVTGFYYYDPAEAGYDEVRRTFDYLRSVQLIGPHIATKEQDADEIDNKLKPVVNGIGETHESTEICVIDADDMLEKPGPVIEAFCRSVGIEYDPSMLDWNNEAEQQQVCEAFEKWRGFHNDAIESKGLTARTHGRPVKTEEEFDAEWRKKYGPEAAALIRKSVDENMADYLYLKQFAMKL
ncbi:P-loop containing nucleoside triphosphate hydrolase protein [Aspergillus coremiiformis]|uniref:P-loop containing nucleoside triphosphate hydrolase protein n=1 Tax=Aspergillus coremiiformis TaxID=138285 RepID=A0A5N6Z6N5_9EURO|nr:P-loop containing nucleoside triphosphate hydrolase protein [Aspergillus coremiiformis]